MDMLIFYPFELAQKTKLSVFFSNLKDKPVNFSPILIGTELWHKNEILYVQRCRKNLQSKMDENIELSFLKPPFTPFKMNFDFQLTLCTRKKC